MAWMAVPLPRQRPHRRGDGRPLRREVAADERTLSRLFRAARIKRDSIDPTAGSVEHFDADALEGLALRLGLHHPDAADLAGGAHVGAAVGLLVEADDVDDP